MALIHRLSGYIVDPTGYYCPQWIEGIVEDNLEDAWLEQFHVETSEPFDWRDDLPENKYNCDLAHLAKHFKANSEGADAKQVKIGAYYKHFKGKLVHVIAVSRHTETQELLVVYAADNGTGTWCRPLSMFLSDVDAVKYPEYAGKKRFELVDMGGGLVNERGEEAPSVRC